MALSIQVDTEVYPPDTEVAIEGVGRFVNGGEAVEIPVSAEEAFYVINGRTLEDGQEGMTVTGTAEFEPPEPEETEEEPEVTEPEPTPEPTPEPVPEPEAPVEGDA